MGRAIARIACFLSIFVGFGAKPGHSADLIWQVENPFRFFKSTRSFAYQEAAFNAVRGDRPAAGRYHLAHRAATQRSRLQGFVLARSLRRDRGQALSAEPPRLGGADAQRQLLRGQRQAAPLFGQLRPQIFVGQCEGRLHPARRAHGRRSRSRPSSSPASPATASGAGSRASGGKAETEAARLQASRSPFRACPIRASAAQSGVSVTVKLPDGRELADARRRGRGSVHRGARQFLRVGRKQSGPSGPVQPLARDGLRPEALA